MNTVFFGYSDIGYEALQTLIALNAPIRAVYTHADSPSEPKWFRCVSTLAKSHNIPTYTHTPTQAELDALQCDMVLCAYYRTLLPTAWVLSRPLDAYNIHGSLLPAFRGAQPTNWAVISGAEKTGITLHKMAPQVDAGDIVGQITTPISCTDTAHTVMQRITPMASELIRTFWDDMIQNTVFATPQDITHSPVYPRRTPADGEIDFRMQAHDIYNLVRGVTYPYPGAFFILNGHKITVWQVEIDMTITTGINGMVVCEGAIKCADGAIRILHATDDAHNDALCLLHTGDIIQNTHRQPT